MTRKSVYKIWIWFILIAKMLMCSPLMLALLIAMPLGAGIVSLVSGDEADDTYRVRAAVYAEGNDMIAQTATDNLCVLSGLVDYYRVSDSEDVYRAVSDGDAAFGYIFPDNLKGMLDAKSYDGCIRVVTGDASYMLRAANELVFKEMFRVYAPEIAENYVNERAEFSRVKERAEVLIRQNYEGYGNNKEISYFQFEVLDTAPGETKQMETAGVTFPLRGVLGVLVMVAAMAGGTLYCRDKRKGIMTALGTGMRLVGAVLYTAVPAILFAISAELALYISGAASYPQELLKMFVYIIILVVINSILSVILPDENVYAGAIPVFAVASLVFCPIFYNITEVSSFAYYISHLLPVYYYVT